MTENKEKLIDTQTEKVNKPVEMVDLQKDREIIVPRGVESWMKKVEEDSSQNQQIKGDDDSVLQPIATGTTKVVLPTNKSTFSRGFSKSVSDAGRWLSEFVFRLIKKSKGNVKFNEE